MRPQPTVALDDFIHAGAGTGLFLIQLSALIPGLLPFLALAGVVIAVLVVPLLVLGAVVAMVGGGAYVTGRLVLRAARSVRGRLRPAAAAPHLTERNPCLPTPSPSSTSTTARP